MKLRQLIEIQQLDRSNFDTYVDYQVEVVSIYKDIDPNDIYEWGIDELNNTFNLANTILNSKSTSKEEIIIEPYSFRKLPFTNLTLGEYIDLEHYITTSDGLLPIITLLYRTYKHSRPIDPIVFEDYGNYSSTRGDMFMDLDIRDVVGVKSEYLEWRDRLHDNYKGLFNQEVDEEDDNDNKKKTIAELKVEQQEKELKQFVWEGILLQLTGGVASNYKDALRMPVIMVFNILSYYKHNS